MGFSTIVSRSSPLLTAWLALTISGRPASAVPPGAPTTVMWDAKCTELTLVGTAPGADLGKDKAVLMKGMCPNGTVVKKGLCWD